MYDDQIYLIGGYNGTVIFDDIWSSSDWGVTWVEVATYNKLLKQLLLIKDDDMTIHCCKLQLKDVTKILKFVKKIQKQMNKYDEYACFHVLVQL